MHSLVPKHATVRLSGYNSIMTDILLAKCACEDQERHVIMFVTALWHQRDMLCCGTWHISVVPKSCDEHDHILFLVSRSTL